MTQRLCLYCGQPGHRTQSSSSTTQVRTLVFLDVTHKQVALPVIVSHKDVNHFISALVDSGAAGNFIDESLVRLLP